MKILQETMFFIIQFRAESKQKESAKALLRNQLGSIDGLKPIDNQFTENSDGRDGQSLDFGWSKGGKVFKKCQYVKRRRKKGAADGHGNSAGHVTLL